ncbi:TPA: AAA family ATPase [Candidatus Poribacteria bacterium]|nr:AAA family ATPase [Candidatus Poribacteria bacterium]
MKQAKQYDKSPILIAKSQNNEKQDLYYCVEGILPCQNCKTENPLSLLSKMEIFELKKKYKVSSSLLKRVQECYENSNSEVDIGAECRSLSGKIFIEQLENTILNKLKKEIRLPTADWLPHIDPTLLKRYNQHVFLTGPSGCGKSTLTAEMIESSLPDSTAWCFGPSISDDPAFKGLQKAMTKKRCKLIDSHKITQPIELSEISKNKQNVLVLDDPESMSDENLKYISDLTSKALFAGRKKGVICFVISHDAFSRRVRSIKASAQECTRCILYPQTQKHTVTKFLKNRMNMSSDIIKKIYKFLQKTDRWMCLVNSHPCCVLTRTGCLLL